jgi:hypothetical protein
MWGWFVWATKEIGDHWDEISHSHKYQTGIFSWDDFIQDAIQGVDRVGDLVQGKGTIITDEEKMMLGAGIGVLLFVIYAKS